MKKIFIIAMMCVFAVCVSFSAEAGTKHKKPSSKKQVTYDYYSNEYVGTPGFVFDIPDSISLCTFGTISFHCDKNKRYWLQYYVQDLYSSVEGLIDEKGREYLGMYNVYKGKHIYFKLDNGEILTLTCNSIKFVHYDYYVGSTDIYKEYLIYSYFELTQEQIDKLCTYEITKMRCELKYDVIDMELDSHYKDINGKHTLGVKSRFDELNKLLNEKLNKDNKQQKLNENPLYGF